MALKLSAHRRQRRWWQLIGIGGFLQCLTEDFSVVSAELGLQRLQHGSWQWPNLWRKIPAQS